MFRDRDSTHYLARFVKWLVRGWRRIDARYNRPAPEGRAWLWTLILPAGAVWYLPLLAALAVTGMALGPAPRLGAPQLVMLVLGLAGLVLVHRDAMRRILRSPQGGFLGWLCAGYLLVLLAMTAVLIVLAGAESFSEPGLVLHVGAAIVIAVTLGLALANWFSVRFLRIAPKGALAPILAKVDLFSPRERYTETDGVIFSTAAFVALMRYPDRILMPGALCLMFIDEATRDVIGRGWQGELWIFAAITGLTWLLTTLGLIYDRLMEMLETIGRIFFVGPQRLVTWLVIGVAVLRLMQVHYIDYLFDGGSLVIVFYALLAYVTACFYGFWSDLLLARRLLPLLADRSGPQGDFRYHVFLRPETRDTGPDRAAAEAGPESDLSSVRAYGRSIALHGAGRFKIEGVHSAAYAQAEGIEEKDSALAFLTAQQLTTRLRALAEEQDSTASLSVVRNVQRGVAIYPPLIALLAFAILGVPGYVGLVDAIQPPELEIRPGPGGSYNLAAALEGIEHPASACPKPAAGAPRIALALSGGGTRAALHGYAVLRGLAADGQICNLIALSGLSGGAATLGYFALHQRELRAPGMNEKAWDTFGEAMKQPFIDDVIAGQSSLRIAYGRYSWRNDACAEPSRPYSRVDGWYPPARTRSGNILAEDFVCKFGAGTTDDAPFAVIFNTSMLGRFDTETSVCDDSTGTLPARARSCVAGLDGSQAGSRLVLTNLPELGRAGDGEKDWLVTLNQPGISLARSAALSANFPPVFPDAPIDVTADGRIGQRYWVTDGGTVETRGLVALLQALNDALADPNVRLSGPLHVIVADASAYGGGYSESWGIGSVLGAGSQLGLALEEQLLDRLNRRLASPTAPGASFHQLFMPRGLVKAIGTHWRLPGQIVLGDPQHYGQGLVGAMRRGLWAQRGESDSVRLGGNEVAALVGCLYSRNGRDIPGLNPAKSAAALAILAREPGTWQNGADWRRLEKTLGVDVAMGATAGLCGGLGPMAPDRRQK